jgi:hypothetical protein
MKTYKSILFFLVLSSTVLMAQDRRFSINSQQMAFYGFENPILTAYSQKVFLYSKDTIHCKTYSKSGQYYINPYYKFGNEEAEDENLIVIPYESYQIDVTQPIYEMITMAIPLRPVHDEDECDEEMVKLIEKFQNQPKEDDNKEDDIDPRWSALKNLN